MRGSRKFVRGGSTVFLVDEGMEDQNTTISGPLLAGQRTAIIWRFAGWLMMT